MKLVLLSDTHMTHNNIVVPDGDVLIHCGDFSFEGTAPEAFAFINWMGEQPHAVKIAISGNHDTSLVSPSAYLVRAMFKESGIEYLENESLIHEGVHFYGSPHTPTFGHGQAFMRNRGQQIAEKWKLIPNDVDVLITHGPPFGVLDPGRYEAHVGCKDLLERVLQIRPQLHVFGHLHEGYGLNQYDTHTLFANVAICDDALNPVHKPVVLEI